MAFEARVAHVRAVARSLSAGLALVAMLVLAPAAWSEPSGSAITGPREPYTETWQQMVDRDQARISEFASGRVPWPSIRVIHDHRWPRAEGEPRQDAVTLLPPAFRPDASPRGGVVTPRAPQLNALGFLGLSLADTDGIGRGGYPPDTCGAIGPNHYVELINGAIAIYDRSGTRISMIGENTFFTVVSGGTTYPRNDCFDPRILYDRRSGRWFALELEFGVGDANNHCMLAVSRSSDPTGTWDKYLVAIGASGLFSDFDTLGVDDNGVYFSVTLFPTSGNPSVRMAATRKASLLAATPSMGTLYLKDTTTSMTGTPHPAHSLDAISSTTPAWFVGSLGSTNANVLLISCTWPATGAPTWGSTVTLTTPAFAVPPTAAAKGSTTKVDACDQRICNAVIRDSKLWLARTVGVNSSGGTSSADRTAAEWIVASVATATPTLVQSGRLYDTATTSPLFYFYNSIMPTGQGHAAMGFSDSSGSRYISTATAGRLGTDAAGTIQSVQQLKDGLNSYTMVFDGYNRWGDYSYTSLDPNDDMTIWTIQEYATATANSWGTYINKLLAPTPTLANPGARATRGTTNVGLSLVGTGFFDPGAGYTNRLAVAITGGSTNGVSNIRVTYNSPTSLTVLYDLSADATTGTRDIKVTNPDGQSVTVTGGLTVASDATTATTLAVAGATGARSATVTLSATLTATTGGAAVPGKAVSFTIDGATVTGSPVTTDASGVATLSYTVAADAAAGSHTIGAAFAGDANFGASTGSGTLTVLTPTALAIPAVTGQAGTTVSISATLTNAVTGATLAGQTVTIAVNGLLAGTSVTTNASGVARLDLAIPSSAGGSKSILVGFAATGSYAACSGSATLTITPSNSATSLAVSAVSGQAGGTVTLTATLKARAAGTGVAGRSIAFTVDGTAVTGSPVTTDSSGIATLSYTIPAGTPDGTQAIGAAFAGDATYDASAGSALLTVGLTDTALSVASASGAPGSSVTLKATLTRSDTGAALAGQAVSFQVDGTSVFGSPVSTDANGLATLNYGIPVGTSSGAHTIAASFATDGTYDAASGTGTLSVSSISTGLTVAGASGAAGGTATLKVTLKRTDTGAVLAGKPVTLKVDGTEVAGSPVTTDASGVASVSYSIPAGASTGAHTIAASFAGDATYSGSTGSGTLTVGSVATSLFVAAPTATAAGANIRIYAYLKQVSDNSMVAGKSLQFTFNTLVAGSATTDANGYAEVWFRIPASTPAGTVPIAVSFAGDGTYSAATKSGTATVNAGAPTRMSVNSPSTGIGATVAITGSLWKASDHTMLQGKALTFSVDGIKVGTGTTDASGNASVTYKVSADATPGEHGIYASFQGDGSYAATGIYGTLSISAAWASSVSTPAFSGTQGMPVTLYSYLWKSQDGSMIQGRTLRFLVDGTQVGAGTTDANGYASITYAIPASTSVGSHTFQAVFDGDGIYEPSSNSSTLTVVAKGDVAWYLASAAGSVGSKVTLYAYIWNKSTSAMLSGKTVTFKIDGATVGSGVSDVNGYVAYKYTIPAGIAKGAHTITAVFAGDASYNASTKTAVLTVL